MLLSDIGVSYFIYNIVMLIVGDCFDNKITDDK